MFRKEEYRLTLKCLTSAPGRTELPGVGTGRTGEEQVWEGGAILAYASLSCLLDAWVAMLSGQLAGGVELPEAPRVSEALLVRRP